MTKFIKTEAFSIGLAMFSMFFGAGNIIFPLAVGQFAGDKNHYAMLGLILTAAVMPIAGVIAMILFDGDYRNFFGRLGRIPGFVLALTIISLLGPLGSTPRCIALAYTTLKSVIFDVSPILFSAISCFIIFLFSFRKTKILTLLGWVLTPFLLVALLIIITVGLLTAGEPPAVEHSNLTMFLHGLSEGYNTMDLLAAFFFSSTILHILRMRTNGEAGSEKSRLKTVFQASMIGCLLLALVYVGFSYLAALHGHGLEISGKDELLAAITLSIAGKYGGPLVCITIALACLTTAIALIAAFTDFVQKEVFQDKIGYVPVLTGGLALTFFVSTFQFTGISAFLGPVLQICYPGLIVLTFLNIAYKLVNFKPVKVPVFATFVLSFLFTQLH